jgi:8-oxo-dGTP pyrophosphatase MutT (NUDIX family)
LPGGHVSGDETPSLAAMNEAKEEVGLTIPLKKLKFLCLTPPQEDKYSFTHHFYYIYDKIYPGFKIQKEEVTEIK